MTLGRVAALLMAAAFSVACNRGNDERAASSGGAGVEDRIEGLNIRLDAPVEAQAGANTFEVTVMQDGQPVPDADVTVELFMAAMPSMNMPEMRSRVSLVRAGDGKYRGTGVVNVAGAWDATVMVMRGDEHLGDRTVTIVAR